VTQIQRWLAQAPEEFTPVFRMIAKRFLGETEKLMLLENVSQ